MPTPDSEPKSELEKQLRQDGIASITLDIEENAFQEISDAYAICIEECPEWLDQTAGNLDSDGVPEDGHVRKDIKFNIAGMQIADPKSLFHFNNDLRDRSINTPFKGPREFTEFVDNGLELHSELTKAAKNLIELLGESYVDIDKLFFPGELGRTTFRLLRYDGYETHNREGELVVEQNAQVAKPHYDRGGMTIQAYSSAPGFWRQIEGAHGINYPKFYPPHGLGQSQMFFGSGFRKVYGSKDALIRPLYHGVDRIFDESKDYVEPRTAAILFVDPPLVDLNITGLDTQPERIDKENLNV